MTTSAAPPSKPLLTPKELADAIGVSESSLRRWADTGDVRVARTAGGHRRIELAEAIRFIRHLGIPVVRPQVLGLAPEPARTPGATDEQTLFEALLGGDREGTKSLVTSWYLRGQTLAEIFDGPVRAALRRVGELWRHDSHGILVEHRATDICAEAVAVLRGLQPPARGEAPLALGGAPEGDPYQLPTLLAGAVLAEAGLRAVNFGPNTPVHALAKEAVDRAARVMWLSITGPPDVGTLRPLLRKVAADLAKRKIHLVLGGRHHAAVAPRARPNVTMVGSMAGLAGFAAKLMTDAPGK